jgi:hypothetical protein
MAKAPPKSLRITHGLCFWTAISLYVGNVKTQVDTPGIPGMICVCHVEKGRGVCVLDGGVLESDR